MLKPRLSVVIRPTRESMDTSPSSTRSRRATTPKAPSKQAAYPTANSCSGLVPPPVTSHLLGRSELHVQRPVARCPVAMVTSARNRCLCCVERPSHSDLLGPTAAPEHGQPARLQMPSIILTD